MLKSRFLRCAPSTYAMCWAPVGMTVWRGKPHPTRSGRDDMRRRGVVLIVVLWVLVILAALAVGLARDTKLDNAVRLAAGERVTARWLARAGVYRGISELVIDDSMTDHEEDAWYDDEQYFRNIELPGGTFSLCADRFNDDNRCAYGIVDEASKLNLNTVTKEMLLGLPEMTDSMASAIIDWRDEKQSSELGLGGEGEEGPGESSAEGSQEAARSVAEILSEGALRTIREVGQAEKDGPQPLNYCEL